MTSWPGEGEIWGVQINSHRAGWDGSICAEPCAWDCSTKLQFREDYCERGERRCFHIDTFATTDPAIVIDDNGGGWLLEEHGDALDGQVILLYCGHYAEPHGVLKRRPRILAGYYVVGRVERIPLEYRTLWRVIPKEGGYGRFDGLKVPLDRFRGLNRPYLKHFETASLGRMCRRLEEESQRLPNADPQRKAAERFLEHLEQWSASAWALNQKRRRLEDTYIPDVGPTLGHNPFAGIEGLGIRPTGDSPPAGLPKGKGDVPAESDRELQIADKQPKPSSHANVVPKAAVVGPDPSNDRGVYEEGEESVTAPAFGNGEFPALVEISDIPRLAVDYGEDVAQAIWLGGMHPNGLILLRGEPGIGKSTLACKLASSENCLIVPVGSTWRGREDLFGYVEPVSGIFQPTGFTRFLADAAAAWRVGDRSPRVAIFEEFNLSPPEYWASDLLVRSQYPLDAEEGRYIDLGGRPPTEWLESKSRVWLAPNVRFVATVNSDHTTRLLSPRVLDRATLVPLDLRVDRIIQMVGLDLTSEQTEAVKALTHRTRTRGVSFSIRTARAIERGMKVAGDAGITAWRIVDQVLGSQLLSRLRLHAGDPSDIAFVESLSDDWDQNFAGNLPLCASRVEEWRSLIDDGLDVIQA